MMVATVGTDGDSAQMPLLGPDEPPPAVVVNPDARSNVLLVCDHASNRLPASLGTLGLGPAELDKHSAWDIGAKDATLRLAEMLDATAVIASYSRMAVDLNRRLDHPTAIPTSSEGVPVPGNLSMTEAEKQARIDAIYRPYHELLEGTVDSYLARGVVPALISIHSYTPVFFGQPRPWHLGVLWVQDGRIPLPFIAGMRDKGYVVGDNEPYDSRILRGATTHMHADGRRVPNVLIEYRNDLLSDPGVADKIIADSAAVLRPVLADPALYSFYDGPVHPHDLALEHEYFERAIRTAHNSNLQGKEDDNG